MTRLLKSVNSNDHMLFNICALDITGLIYIYSYKNNRSYKTIDQHRYILYSTVCAIIPSKSVFIPAPGLRQFSLNLFQKPCDTKGHTTLHC